MIHEIHMRLIKLNYSCTNSNPNFQLSVLRRYLELIKPCIVLSRGNPNWILIFKGLVIKKKLRKWEGKFWGTTVAPVQSS